MNDHQRTLWEWAQDNAQHLEEAIRPRVQGKLTLTELPVAPADEMFTRIRNARALHVMLEARLGTIDLVITDNRRRMVSARRKGERHEMRLHHMFLDAGEALAHDLVDFMSGGAEARASIQAFIRQRRDAIRHDVDPAELRTLGQFHDLQWILDGVRDYLRDDDLDGVTITWGRRGKGRRSIRFGSFDFDQRLVRIHPALDQRWVPTYFLEYIVYHELLHALYPPTLDEAGRRCVHTEEFKAMEKRFPRYEEALAWEAAHIRRLLDAGP